MTVGPRVSVTGPALVILHPALPTWTVPASQTKRISISTEVVAATGRAVVGIGRVGGSVGAVGGGSGGGSGSGERSGDASGSGERSGDASGVGKGGGGGEGESTTTSTHTSLVTRVVTVQRAGGTGT